MKTSVLIGLLLIGGVTFYCLGGSEWLGYGETTGLPETADTPHATFIGNEHDNPFVGADSE